MSDYKVKTKSNINAKATIPSSKSYTNRAFIISAMAEGVTALYNILESEDTSHMQNALSLLGIKIERKGDKADVRGGIKDLKEQPKEIFLGNSGTSIRFLVPFCAFVKGRTVLTGDRRLKERPMEDLLSALKQAGVNARSLNGNGKAPVAIEGNGAIKGGTVNISGEISSQYLSALLLVAPYAEQDVEINIVGKLVSKPYIDITADIMKAFGVNVANENYKKFRIAGGQRYKPCEYSIPSDYSSASYFFAAAAVTGGTVKASGLDINSRQGDAKFLDILERMGCDIIRNEQCIEVKGPKTLKGVDVNMNDCPDSAMTLAVISAFAEGKTIIKDIYNLRVKECDRIKAVASELNKLGVKAEELKDGMIIHGDPKMNGYHGALVETYNDHRIAMSFSLFGLNVPKVVIKNKECVAKTFPDYWERFLAL